MPKSTWHALGLTVAWQHRDADDGSIVSLDPTMFFATHVRQKTTCADGSESEDRMKACLLS